MYFLRKIIFHFPSKEKISYFSKKKNHLSRCTRKIVFQRDFFWKDHLFRTFEENTIFPCILSERSPFIFCLKNKMIFLGKKIVFQRSFFGKMIFSENLKKENVVFSAVFLVKSSHRWCPVRTAVLKDFPNFKGKYLSWVLFLIKLQVWINSNADVLPWNLQKTFKNTYCEELLWKTVSI